VSGSPKLLRGLEAGTRAGWLVVAGVGVLLLWRLFGPKRSTGAIEEVVEVPDPVGPAGAGDAPEPRNQAEPQGVVGGSLMSGITAQIVDPAQGGKVYRRAFSSSFPATIEVVSVMREAHGIQIEVVADYYEFAGAERRGIRTRFPTRQVPGDSVERFEVLIDSGNFNGLAYELGQANAVVRVLVNGIQTQSTAFEVW
jgi:hypothetical protein